MHLDTVKCRKNTLEYVAFTGVGIGVAAVIVAIAVTLRRRSKTSPPSRFRMSRQVRKAKTLRI